MSVDTAVIPVAGLGTRMLPVSRLVPKEFLPLGRKSAIHFVAEELRDAGIRRMIFVVSPRKTSLHNLFGDPANRLEGFEETEFEYVVQDEQLGLGHAILCAAEMVADSSFAVALGDCLIGLPGQTDLLQQMIRHKSKNGIAIGFEHVPQERVHRYGIAMTDSNDPVFRLNGLVEKPSIENAPSRLAICGRYVLQPSIFEALKQTSFDEKNELQLTDAINRIIDDGVSATGVRLADGVKRYDIGNMESYTHAYTEFAMCDDALKTVIAQCLNRKNDSDH